MIFVCVGDNDRFDLILNHVKITEIRHQYIYPMHTFIRETHPYINDDCSRFCLQNSNIPTDFSESSQWCKAYFSSGIDIDLLPWIESCFLDLSVGKD